MPNGAMVLGNSGKWVCPGCSANLQMEARFVPDDHQPAVDTGSGRVERGFYVWSEPRHAATCLEYARWSERRETEQIEQMRRQQNSPFPAARLAEIRRRTGIPSFVRGGLGTESAGIPWSPGRDAVEIDAYALHCCRELRDGILSRKTPAPPGIWLQGDTGSGKTLLLGALAADLAFRMPGLRVRYIELDALMQRHYAAMKEGGPAFSLRSFLSCDLLVLDDIGTCGSTAAPAEMLERIAEAFYAKPADGDTPQTACLAVASNECPAQLTASLTAAKPKANRYGDRVTRRLLNVCGSPIEMKTTPR